MITQQEVDELLVMLKCISSPKNFCYPSYNQKCSLDLTSEDGRKKFVLDINRCGKIKISKYSLQNRFRTSIILLRLDIDGSEHINPNGDRLSRNHLHIYKEGHGDSWATDIPPQFIDLSDPVGTLINFLQYCRVTNYADLELQGAL